MVKKICIYHANCADGFTAAWVVMRWSDEWAGPTEYIPASYGQVPPDVSGADVLMVDFSYKRPVLLEMADSARSITILDHHKTAEAELTGLGMKRPNLDIHFDMERSGAQMAWDFFCDNTPRPLLVDYVGDRDLWRWQMEGSREVSAVIASHDQTFDTWDDLAARMQADRDVGQVIDEGAAILRKLNKDVDTIIGCSKRMMRIGGYLVPVANCPPFLASEVAGKMAEQAPFAATYYDGPDGRGFSLRSRGKPGIDVAEVAASYGGGGHRNASGFLAARGWEGDVEKTPA